MARAADQDDAFLPDVRLFGLGRAAAFALDGSLVVGGSFARAGGEDASNLVRFLPDGSRDPDFTSPSLNGSVRALAVQSDGKIVIGGVFTEVGGISRPRIARLLADGALDTSFTPGTGFNSEVFTLALQSDGKVVAGGAFTSFAGTTRNRVARLNTDGTLDTTFLNTGAGANGIVWSLALQSNGQAVIGGAFTSYNGTTRNRVARLTTAGALDTTFLNTGAGANNDVYAVALDSAGRVLIGGFFWQYNGTARDHIARLTTAGALDTAFDPGSGFGNISGTGNTLVTALAVDSADRVVVGGRFDTFNGSGFGVSAGGLARLAVNGAIDASFDLSVSPAAVHRRGYVHALLATPGDGVVALGELHEPATGQGGMTVRASTGARAASASPARGLEYAPVINAVRPGALGRYYVAGDFDWIAGDTRHGIARFQPDADLDATFVPASFGGSAFDAPVLDVVELASGDVRAFGGFSTFGGSTRTGAARFNASGSLAGTDSELTVAGGNVRRALLGPDGQLYLAGTFTAINGSPRAGVARLNPATGALDAAYLPGSGPSGGQILDADIDASGRLLVAGAFTGFSGVGESFLVRLAAANGAVDTAFAANTALSNSVFSVQALPGDEVLVGGAFETSGGFTVNGVDRLLATGASDPDFNPGAGTAGSGAVTAARADAEGNILVAGSFTSFRGEWRAGLAQLTSAGTLTALHAATDLGAGTAFDFHFRPDGKALLRGAFAERIVRLHGAPVRRGALSSALAGAPAPNNAVRAVVPAADGEFVLAGEFTTLGGAARNRIVKVDTLGRLDAAAPYAGGFNATVHGGLAEPSTGGALFWGAFSAYDGASAPGLLRLLADGTRDPAFTPPVFNAEVRAVLRLPDGGYLVGGAFTSAGASPAGGLARLLPSGALDPAFDAGTGANGSVLALVRAADGSFYAGGAFTTFAGAAAPGVVKLGADGARAPGHAVGSGIPSAAQPVRALALQADGRLLVGGDFTTFADVATPRFARLATDGTLDATFLGGLGANGSVHALAALADGRIYVGGDFTALGGGERRGLARLSAQGRIDPAFDIGAGYNDSVFALAPLADGALATGGCFTAVDAETRARFAIHYASDDGVPAVPGDELEVLEVDPGEPFFLGFAGAPETFSFQWYRDGEPLAGQTGLTYSVASAALADLGLYTVVIRNGAGEFTTAGTQVIVRLAPVPATAPSAVSTGYGSTATFSVTAAGPGPFTYQWYRGSDEIPGATAATYSLTDVGDDDFGATFFVRITNDYGFTDTAPVALTFDPAAVPGALTRAFAAADPAFTQNTHAIVRLADGRLYIGTENALVRLTADGGADPTFAPAFSSISVTALALQSDGKLLVAGFITPVGGTVQRLVRLNANGSLDTTYTSPAILNSGFSGTLFALALASDGKLYVGGQFTTINGTARQHLARLNTDGSLDAGFAPTDNATGPNAAVRALHVVGATLVVAGDFTTYRNAAAGRIARVTAANALDPAFLPSGGANGQIDEILAQPDGKLLVRGAFTTYGGQPRNRLARLNANGALDTSFAFGAGPVSANNFDPATINGFALSDGGSVVVTGSFAGFSGWPAVNAVRLTSTGAIDTQWATPANQPINRLFGLSDGRLFVSGFFNIPGISANQRLARLQGGIFPPQAPAITIQPALSAFARAAGSRVTLSALASGPGELSFRWYRGGVALDDSDTVSGATTPMLTLRSARLAEAGNYTLRVTSSTTGHVDSAAATLNLQPERPGLGALDLTWAADPLPRTPVAFVRAGDGSTFIATDAFGGERPVVHKLDAAGRLLPGTTFTTTTGFDFSVTGLALQSDAKLIVGGAFTEVQGAARSYLARLLTNGAYDSTFTLAINGAVNALVTQSDGKILVLGSFTSFAGTSRAGIARLNANGTHDTDFTPGAHGLAEIIGAAVASDGKIVIFGRNNTTFTDDVLRLNANGTLDNTFTRVTASYSLINDLAIDSANRPVLGGRFTSLAGQSANRIARLTTTGGLDTTFGPVLSAGPTFSVGRVLVAPDGYIYLASDSGSGGSYDGFTLGLVVRLDGSGKIDTQFPAADTPRITSISPASLAWHEGRLAVLGGIGGLARSQFVRLVPTGGPVGAPVVVESSGDRTVVEGLALNLSVRVTGAGPFQYVWRKDGDIIPGAASPQLTLATAGPETVGVYQVEITGSGGSTQVTMQVGLLPAEPLSPVAGVNLPAGAFNGAINDALRLPDGSTIVGGSFSTVAGQDRRGLARITPEGTLDATFTSPLFESNSVESIAREADGRLLVFGNLQLPGSTFAYLLRLNADGTLAATLLNPANTSAKPSTFARQSDGKLVFAGGFTSLAGIARAGLARLLADGVTHDPAFHGGGLQASGAIAGLGLDSAGRILIGGQVTSINGAATSGRVHRLLADGNIDPAFRERALVQSPNRFFVAADGRLYAYSTNTTLLQADGQNRSLVRLLPDGTLDPTFVSSRTGTVNALGEDALGRLFVVGGNRLERLFSNGLLDRGVSLFNAPSVLLGLPDRLIIAGGNQLTSINGVSVPGFAYVNPGAEESLAVVTSPPAQNQTAQGGSAVVLRAGVRAPTGATFQWFRGGVAVDGATAPELILAADDAETAGSYVLVTTLGENSVSTTPAQVVVLPNLGRPGEIDLAWGEGLFVSGSITSHVAGVGNQSFVTGAIQLDGAPVRPLLALDATGAVRADFTLDARVTGTAFGLHVLGDGRLLLWGGSGLLLDGVATPLIRLTAAGAVDATFTVGRPTGGSAAIIRLRPLGDGRLVAVGNFTAYNGVAAANIARLSADGAVDASYAPGALGTPNTTDLLPAPGGGLWLVGTVFDSILNLPRALTRLDADGVLDETYARPVLRPNETLTRAAAAPDGGLYLLIRYTPDGLFASSRLVPVSAAGAPQAAIDLGVFAPEGASFTALARDPEGRFLLAGYFTAVDGVPRNNIVRILPDGAADPAFTSPSALNVTSNNCADHLLVLPSGRILATGANLVGYGGVNDRARVYGLHGGEPDPDVAPTALAPSSTSLALAPYNPLSLGLPALAPADAEIQWFRNGSSLAGETGPRLRRAAASADAGLYHATVTTSGGSIVTPAVAVSVPNTAYSGALGAANAGVVGDRPVLFTVPRPGGGALVVSHGSVINGEGPFELFFVDEDGEFDGGLPTLVALGSFSSAISSALVAPDGKIYIGGTFARVNGVAQNRLARLLPDGSLDTAWVPASITSGDVSRLALDSQGRLIIGGSFTTVGGESRARIARLTATGALDTTFVVGTGLPSVPLALLVQADDRVLVGGNFTTYNGATVGRLIRLGTTGALDGGFNPAPSAQINALAVDASGRFYVGGTFTQIAGESRAGLVRFSAAGVLDDTVYASANNTTALAITPAGEAFVLQGNSVQRYRPDGSRDTLFNSANGYRGAFRQATNTNPVNPSSLVATGGAVLVAGPFARSGDAIRNGLAWLAPSDSAAPVIVTAPADSALPSGGRVVLSVVAQTTVGSLTYVWTKLGDDTVLSTSASLTLSNVSASQAGVYRVRVANGEGFAEALVNISIASAPAPAPGRVDLGFHAPALSSAAGVAPAEGGGWWAADSSGLVRLLANGDLDAGYAKLTVAGGSVSRIAVDSQGRLYLGGSFTALGGHPSPRVARLTALGAVDTSFVSAFPSTGGFMLNALAPAPGGGIYVGGSFEGIDVAGVPSNHLVRLSATGLVDDAFAVRGGTNIAVQALLVLADGRLLVGGSFTTIAGASRAGLARLLADGTVDPTFNNIAISNVQSLAELPDGRLLVGGGFTTVDGLGRARLARLSADGFVDPAFNAEQPFTVTSILARPDDRILVAGSGRIRQLLSNGGVDPAYDESLEFTLGGSSLRLTLLADGRVFANSGSGLTLNNGVYRPGLVLLQGASLLPDPVAQTISFAPLADRAFSLDPISLVASSDSELVVVFTVVSGPAVIDAGDQLLLTGAGTVTVRAEQPGDATYAPADPVTRSFVVTENFAAWQIATFSEAQLANPLVSGPNADPDGDGRPNLLEYAFGTLPLVSDRDAVAEPELERETGIWVFRYTRPVGGAPGVVYQVEYSGTLAGWDDVAAVVESTNGAYETLRAEVPLSGARVFARLRVTVAAE